jgi:predicted nucleic acid-binding protein
VSSKRTFIDSDVLIAAARGRSEQSKMAMQILDDPSREFVSSPFVKLEVLPKAIFNKKRHEGSSPWQAEP